LPLGLAVDEKGQHLFVSDGKNNRVMICNIRPEVLKNGPEAIGVLGQKDFNNTAPQDGAMDLFDPGRFIFDQAYQQLFVVDYQHKRVLVFDVDRQRFSNGATAINVIGQANFSSNTTSLDRNTKVDGKHIYSSNGIAFDAGQQLLYAADGSETYNNRVDRALVFDVHPKRLQNGGEAIAAIDAQSAETPVSNVFGGPESYFGQFTIRDTRGIVLGAQKGRLFTTGSFESRVVVFYFPRASWKYVVDARGYAIIQHIRCS